MFVVYVAFGLWMLFGANYAIGDAIARASAARSIAHSRDQHLMAAGFYWMPWPTYAEVPFMAVFSRLGIQELAMVLPTAIAGAMTLPLLARLARDLGVARKWAIASVILYAVNPYTIFFSANGMSEIWLVLFLTGATGAYMRWARTRRVRDLGYLGMWLAMAQLSRYESLVFTLVFAGGVAWQTAKGRRANAFFTVALPGLFVLFVWTVVAFFITNDSWWHVIQQAAPPDKIYVIWSGHTLPAVMWYVVRLSVRMAPGLLIVAIMAGLPREVLGQFRRRDREPMLTAPLVATALFFPAQVALFLLSYRTYGDPRYFTPLVLMFFLFALIALSRGRARLRGPLIVALAIAAWFSCGATISNPAVSAVTGEPIVVRKLLGRPTTGISFLDIGSIRETARAIDRQLRPGDVLVLDSARSQALHFFSNKPQQIATDRDKSNERFLAQAKTDYTAALLNLNPAENPAAATATTASIADLITRNPAGKRWIQVEIPNRGGASGPTQLWLLRPDASAKTSTAPTAAPPTSAPRSAPARPTQEDSE